MIISAVTSPTVPRIGAAKPLVGASGSSAAITAPPLMPRMRVQDAGRDVLLAEHDRLHEGQRTGGLHAFRVRRRVDVDDPGHVAGRRAGLAGTDLAAVDADADDGPVGDEGQPARAHDVAALGAQADQVEGDARAQRRLDGGDVPVGQPLVVDLRQGRLGGVGPAVRSDRPRPVEDGLGGRRAVALGLGDVGDADRGREVAQPLDRLRVLRPDGRGVALAEPDVGEVPGRQRAGQRLGGRLRGAAVGTAGRVAGSGGVVGGACGEDQHGPDDEEPADAHARLSTKRVRVTQPTVASGRNRTVVRLWSLKVGLPHRR